MPFTVTDVHAFLLSNGFYSNSFRWEGNTLVVDLRAANKRFHRSPSVNTLTFRDLKLQGNRQVVDVQWNGGGQDITNLEWLRQNISDATPPAYTPPPPAYSNPYSNQQTGNYDRPSWQQTRSQLTASALHTLERLCDHLAGAATPGSDI